MKSALEYALLLPLVLFGRSRLNPGLAGPVPMHLFPLSESGRLVFLIPPPLFLVSFYYFISFLVFILFFFLGPSNSPCPRCHVSHWGGECFPICISFSPCFLKLFSTEPWPCQDCIDRSILASTRGNIPPSTFLIFFIFFFL